MTQAGRARRWGQAGGVPGESDQRAFSRVGAYMALAAQAGGPWPDVAAAQSCKSIRTRRPGSQVKQRLVAAADRTDERPRSRTGLQLALLEQGARGWPGGGPQCPIGRGTEN